MYNWAVQKFSKYGTETVFICYSMKNALGSRVLVDRLIENFNEKDRTLKETSNEFLKHRIFTIN